MKFFARIVISALFIGISHGHILGILRDLSPVISDISDQISGLLKNTGGLIGDTFSSLDSIVESAEDSITQLTQNIEEILAGCADDQQHQQCASALRAASEGVNSTILKLCVDETRYRNTLSAKLVQISKLRTQCQTTFTRCLSTPPVDKCIQTEVDSVKTGIQENEVSLHQDVESIQTEVKECVDSRAQQACGTLQSAIDEYKRCSGDE